MFLFVFCCAPLQVLVVTKGYSGEQNGQWKEKTWSCTSVQPMHDGNYNLCAYCKHQAYTKTPLSKKLHTYTHTHKQQHHKHWPHTWLTPPTAYSHCSIGHSCHSPCPNSLHRYSTSLEHTTQCLFHSLNCTQCLYHSIAHNGDCKCTSMYSYTVPDPQACTHEYMHVQFHHTPSDSQLNNSTTGLPGVQVNTSNRWNNNNYSTLLRVTFAQNILFLGPRMFWNHHQWRLVTYDRWQVQSILCIHNSSSKQTFTLT